MRIGVISDIHGNLPALDATLAALEQAGVDRILCAGDVVGYGPDPTACVERVRDRNILCVKGNHDAHTGEPPDRWEVQPDAHAALLWTCQALPPEHRQWLANLPLELAVDDVRLVHASHALWPAWPYVIDDLSATENFLFQATALAFNGHTHVPLCAVHEPHCRPRVTLLQNMLLPRHRRLLVGVGSVGQPRDGDPRAAAVILDTDRLSLRVLRVAYDLESVQHHILRLGLPAELARRLAYGR